jgi:hypothetical protein
VSRSRARAAPWTSRLSLGGLATLTALSGACQHEPKTVFVEAVRATAAGRAEALRPLLHPAYADTLGGGDELVGQLSAFFDAHPPEAFDASIDSVQSDGASKRRLVLHAFVEGAWGGAPGFRVSGPMRVTLEPWGGYKLRAGYLTDVRDVARLVKAWTVARRDPSPATLRPLLHPGYEDDFVTRDEIATAWRAHGPELAEVTMVRLEVRDDLAHLDLHELVGGGAARQPVIHRLTLRPAAGRWWIASGLRFEPRATERPKLAPADEVR